MSGTKSYRPWSPEQPYLLPPSPAEWLPEDHLARRFSMRGLQKARGEWGLVCMCHNVRRLHAARGAGRMSSLR